MTIDNLHQVADLLREMSSKREYHFPVVAAQHQFRNRYYGLLSAAMLEDLFYDALAHFLSSHSPDCEMARPKRGEKGWDYSIDGLQISHKVSKKGAQEIAVLWDATRTDITTYTYGSAISLSVGSYSPAKIRMTSSDGVQQSVVPLSEIDEVRAGSHLLLLSWDSTRSATVLHHWTSLISGPVSEAFKFREIWAEVARMGIRDIPANHLECVVLSPSIKPPSVNSVLEISVNCRPGTYLIPKSELKDIPVVFNNRGVLIPKNVVLTKMEGAVADGLFVPMPLWFSAFVGDRPPDLYIVQRNDFDRFFSSGTN